MKKITIAFQGEKGAYSELAAKRYFKSNKLDLIPQKTFADVFHAIAKRKVDCGIVPVENTLNGGIREVFNLLDEQSVYVTGEIKLRISHMLLGVGGAKLSGIKKVYSHPQALLQCRKFIHGAGLSQAEYYDTAGAAKFVSELGDPSVAAIAGLSAAEDYGLKILKKHIESDGKNFTRFLVVTRESYVPGDADKTTIIFSVKSQPGALHKSLSVFAIRDIDLLSIDSIPNVGRPWEYKFFVDFRGGVFGEAQSKAIEHLREICPHVKLIGSYKEGRTEY